MFSMPAGTKEPIKFHLIPQCSHRPPPSQSLEEEEEEEEDEEEEEGGEQSFSSSEAEGEHRGEELPSNNFKWAEQECCQHRNQRAAQSVTLNKGKKINIHKVSLQKGALAYKIKYLKFVFFF